MKCRIAFYFIILLSVFSLAPASPLLSPVQFALEQELNGGEELWIVGEHPMLGGNQSNRAHKLVWSEGNIWRGTIALPAGEQITYKAISQSANSTGWCGEQSYTVQQSAAITSPIRPRAPWRGKVIFYESGWEEAYIYWHDSSNDSWVTTKMERVGVGSIAGNHLYRAESVGAAGEELEFVFHNGGATDWDNAPGPPTNSPEGSAPATPVPYQAMFGPFNYRTALDFIHVRGGNVFNYHPPVEMSEPRIEVRQIESTVGGIGNRSIRIYLPRGYDQNTTKRYPVLYMHDGQNVFFPGGGFGTWDADRIANYEIAAGRMREAIIVGIDNSNARMEEYRPPGDSYLGNNGRGDAYAQFIRDNVIPTIDVHYRSFAGIASETMIAGSSLGGLISCYLSLNDPGRYGAAGILSPSYWIADNYVAQRNQSDHLPLRRFLYMGTAEGGSEGSGESLSDAVQAYNHWVGTGQVINDELDFSVGCGAPHNESAWSAQLPRMFQFLLNPWREAQPLMVSEIVKFPLLNLEKTGEQRHFTMLKFYGLEQSLEKSEDLRQWTEVAEVAPASFPWDMSQTDDVSTEQREFWRLRIRNPW